MAAYLVWRWPYPIRIPRWSLVLAASKQRRHGSPTTSNRSGQVPHSVGTVRDSGEEVADASQSDKGWDVDVDTHFRSRRGGQFSSGVVRGPRDRATGKIRIVADDGRYAEGHVHWRPASVFGRYHPDRCSA